LGGDYSNAQAVNNAGQVAGQAGLANGEYHAFIGTTGGLVDLGTLGGAYGQGWGINNVGQVVGTSTDTAGKARAFVTLANTMVDLNSLVDESGTGWTFELASAINDAGQITGHGFFQGRTAAFLLSPVPEPSQELLLLVGLGAIFGVARRRRPCSKVA
jgi:probable HAF family extracellular repeat protein